MIQESTRKISKSAADLRTMLASTVANKLLSSLSMQNKRMASVPTLTSDQSDDFKDYVFITQEETPLKVFIAGKVGTGKSSLVSTITGRKVAGEGSLTTSIIYLNGQILTTEKTQAKFIDITAWNAPGFGNPFGNDEANFKKIQKKCRSADLLLYCLDMRQRLSKDDVNAITQLTKDLGVDIWKNAVFVLTFANQVQPPPESGKQQCKFFEEKLHTWKDAIIQLLQRKLSVPENIIKDIAIIPTGYQEENPPDRNNWLTWFWVEAFRKVKECALPAIIGMSSNTDMLDVSAYPGDSESIGTFNFLDQIRNFITGVQNTFCAKEEAKGELSTSEAKLPRSDKTQSSTEAKPMDQNSTLENEFELVDN